MWKHAVAIDSAQRIKGCGEAGVKASSRAAYKRAVTVSSFRQRRSVQLAEQKFLGLEDFVRSSSEILLNFWVFTYLEVERCVQISLLLSLSLALSKIKNRSWLQNVLPMLDYDLIGTLVRRKESDLFTIEDESGCWKIEPFCCTLDSAKVGSECLPVPLASASVPESALGEPLESLHVTVMCFTLLFINFSSVSARPVRLLMLEVKALLIIILVLGVVVFHFLVPGPLFEKFCACSDHCILQKADSDGGVIGLAISLPLYLVAA
ncbi:hypothetical protein Tco_0732065 [Tanacetum coccineum]